MSTRLRFRQSKSPSLPGVAIGIASGVSGRREPTVLRTGSGLRGTEGSIRTLQGKIQRWENGVARQVCLPQGGLREGPDPVGHLLLLCDRGRRGWGPGGKARPRARSMGLLLSLLSLPSPGETH